MYAKIILPVILALTATYFSKTIKNQLLSVFGPTQSNPKSSKLFTSDELKLYNGVDKPELYLAILGRVFDVTKGVDHYAPGRTYHFFIGKDASRSFITGEFQGDGQDNVADLTQEDLRSLNHWLTFYGKEYTRVGKLVGKYYNENGKLTPYGKQIKKLIQVAEEAKNQQQQEKQKFPPCNIEWDQDRGTHVWCTKQSGGIQRQWEGVPRQLYEPGQNPRCACINDKHLHLEIIKEYENCDKQSTSCYIKS